MGESNGWFNTVEVRYKGGKRTFVVVKCEIVQFEDFFKEASKGFCRRLDLTSFCQFLLNYSKSIVCLY